jgi:SAM-dependent MidA family methyltransferase
MNVLGYTSQAHFLINSGLLDLLEKASPAERAMAQKLITEHEMGELFKVVALGGWHPSRLGAHGLSIGRQVSDTMKLFFTKEFG